MARLRANIVIIYDLCSNLSSLSRFKWLTGNRQRHVQQIFRYEKKESGHKSTKFMAHYLLYWFSAKYFLSPNFQFYRLMVFHVLPLFKNLAFALKRNSSNFIQDSFFSLSLSLRESRMKVKIMIMYKMLFFSRKFCVCAFWFLSFSLDKILKED